MYKSRLDCRSAMCQGPLRHLARNVNKPEKKLRNLKKKKTQLISSSRRPKLHPDIQPRLALVFGWYEARLFRGTDQRENPKKIQFLSAAVVLGSCTGQKKNFTSQGLEIGNWKHGKVENRMPEI